jgi:two-component system response regulator (stage 0 sporulation protein F)
VREARKRGALGGKETRGVKKEDSSMRRILVVDDEENIRELYRDELVEEGYEVELATDGLEALRKFDSFRPDLVTLDVKMPGLDGLEVLRRIREKNASVPVLLLTAFGEFKQDFTTWASDAYIVKSHDTKELKTTVKRLLGEK